MKHASLNFLFDCRFCLIAVRTDVNVRSRPTPTRLDRTHAPRRPNISKSPTNVIQVRKIHTSVTQKVLCQRWASNPGPMAWQFSVPSIKLKG